MPLPRRPGDLTPLERTACLEHLAEASFGRLAFVDESGRPTILPVNHVIHDEMLYFRTAPGSKLGIAADDAQVAFEVDAGDAERRGGWSVVVHGHARIETDRDVLETLHNLPFSPWTDPDERPFWVAVSLDEISGRAVS